MYIILLAAALVAPRNYYGNIGQRLATMIPDYHVSQRPIDSEISQRAWTNLVSYYDIDHSVLLQSDLEKLKRRESTLGRELIRGNVSFGYDLYNMFLGRLNERIDFATNLLAKGEWDFSVDESYPVKRKDAPWPQTKEEAEDYWRKRIKNEVLAMKINRELDAEAKANKPEKPKDEEDGEETTAKPEETIEQSLIKKYRQYGMVLNEPDDETVLQNYLSAIARAYDPHTDYMSPATKEDFDMDMNLTLYGVGAVLNMEDGALKIVEIMDGGPIDLDGRIKAGDKIVGIQQEGGEMEDIMWQPSKKSINKIRGPKGSKVTLEIIPKSDPSGVTRKLITLTRDKINLEEQAATGRVERVTIDGKDLKLGYVFLPSFYGTMDKRFGDEGFRSCTLDVNKYVADFNAQGVDGMILDLRGNGGGSLPEAIRLSSLFVQRGPVVQLKDVHVAGAIPLPPGNVVAFRKPLVVMVDRASASASEIVAGHLQDTGRAIVVGDSRTHGKGTVQTIYGMGPEKYGSTKITTARFYRVNGRSTQVEGVEPDIKLPSLLDALDIGEDKLTYSLPFSKIEQADYQMSWNTRDLVDRLRSKSEERTAQDERYQAHAKNVQGMKAIGDREEVPLEYGARKAMMASDRELRELDDDDEESSEEKILARRRKNQKQKDDVVLDEAFRVLGDMIIINDGDKMPQTRGWWE